MHVSVGIKGECWVYGELEKRDPLDANWLWCELYGGEKSESDRMGLSSIILAWTVLKSCFFSPKGLNNCSFQKLSLVQLVVNKYGDCSQSPMIELDNPWYLIGEDMQY